MTWKVLVPNKVRKRIADLGFSKQMLVEVYRAMLKALVDDSNVNPIVAPVPCVWSDFCVVSPDDCKEYHFTVWADQRRQPGARIVFDFDFRITDHYSFPPDVVDE